MPCGNHFRHQRYSADEPPGSYVLLDPPLPPLPGTPQFAQRMQRVGAALRAAGVRCVYLIHGTFVGPDALGIVGDLERLLPEWGQRLRRAFKAAADRVVGDRGNYTQRYAELLEQALHVPGDDPLPVRRFFWSSENHHLGRADGAIRLLDELRRSGHTQRGCVLLWAHSHGGNVLALVSNLLGGTPEVRRRFFDAARPYYYNRWTGRIELPIWERVASWLCSEHEPAALPILGTRLDMVTFGTPVRYGWETCGYGRLLHFAHHVPAPELPAFRARFPPSAEDILQGRGDTVQLIGIAGTNLIPSLLAWRTLAADRRLHRLLQPDVPQADLWRRLCCGQRVHADGNTLLVDYFQAAPYLAQHLAGHAVYTREEWMLFHAEEVARRFYHLDGRA
jgi:hypothetical protein